jgi:hypothetical protein
MNILWLSFRKVQIVSCFQARFSYVCTEVVSLSERVLATIAETLIDQMSKHALDERQSAS